MSEFPLGSLNACEIDLTAAHQHATDAAAGLSDARHSRAVELAELIADAIAFCRRLSICVQGDQRAEL
jgi:hypothetical protein